MMEVVTGGSGSGKSAYAEQKICGLQQGTGRLYYIATMYPYGSETERRLRDTAGCGAEKDSGHWNGIPVCQSA